MLVFNLQNLGQGLSCGLLGRSKRAQVTRRTRTDSFGSVIRGGSSSHTNAPNRARAQSDVSIDDTSIIGTGRVESGDEDAGMLDDLDIARFGHTPYASTRSSPPPNHSTNLGTASNVADDAEAEQQRRARIQEETLRAAAEAEAEAVAQKQEEVGLAAEEEAAVLKARRKAERKAAKRGLLPSSTPTPAQTWRSEADAEAAAGGFDLSEVFTADEDESAFSVQSDYENAHLYHPEPDGYDQYDDAEEYDGYVHSEQAPNGVVHHHHYYHHTPVSQAEALVASPVSLTHAAGQHVAAQAEPEAVASEDEADIAGLSFGRKKKRHVSGSRGSASASGNGQSVRSSQRPEAPSSRGSGSGSAVRDHRTQDSFTSSLACPSAVSSSAMNSSPNAGLSPRRERTVSISTNSSSGNHSYQSGGKAAASTIATSIAPSAYASNLPNLYDKAGSHPLHGTNGDAGSLYRERQHNSVAAAAGGGSRFGRSAVDADEFGIITAGKDRGGAGRAKKTYRDKRHPQPAPGAPDTSSSAFEGFPGF